MTSSSILDGFLTATPMKAPPDDVKLSREEGQALIERLQANTLTGEDRGLLVKLIQLYLVVFLKWILYSFPIEFLD